MNRREMLKAALVAPLAVFVKDEKTEPKVIEEAGTLQTWRTVIYPGDATSNGSQFLTVVYIVQPDKSIMIKAMKGV